MAPRIKNISPDEFRRLFQAPQIEAPGFTTSDAINLQNALEARRRNELAEQEKIAKIERSIAEQEARAKDVETLALQRGTDAEREARELAREGINPAQPGPEAGPFSAEDQAAIDQAREAAQAETRLDPLGAIKSKSQEDRDLAAAQRKLADQVKLLQEKGRQERLTLSAKEKESSKKAQNKISALGKSKIFATEGFQNLVTELTAGEKAIPKSFIKRLGIKADSFTGGNLGEQLSRLGINMTNSEAILFDQQRESLAVAVYKFVSGDVGNIAASESKRALKLIPSITDSADLRATKIQALQRAADRAKTALDTLINDPNSALLTSKQLENAQRAIADEALAFAGSEIGEAAATGELTPEQATEAQASGAFEILSVEDE